jgi:hypothetical protein
MVPIFHHSIDVEVTIEREQNLSEIGADPEQLKEELSRTAALIYMVDHRENLERFACRSRYILEGVG